MVTAVYCVWGKKQKRSEQMIETSRFCLISLEKHFVCVFQHFF